MVLVLEERPHREVVERRHVEKKKKPEEAAPTVTGADIYIYVSFVFLT
jgi:hypothetical protein